MTELTKGRMINTVDVKGEVYYARKGEMVYCENGHEIGRIARDMVNGAIMLGDEIEGYKRLRYGETFPTCPLCDGFFTIADDGTFYRGGFLFKCEETGEIVGRI